MTKTKGFDLLHWYEQEVQATKSVVSHLYLELFTPFKTKRNLVLTNSYLKTNTFISLLK